MDDRVSGFFTRVAGDDMEIDSGELKGVLDYSLTKGQLCVIFSYFYNVIITVLSGILK